MRCLDPLTALLTLLMALASGCAAGSPRDAADSKGRRSLSDPGRDLVNLLLVSAEDDSPLCGSFEFETAEQGIISVDADDGTVIVPPDACLLIDDRCVGPLDDTWSPQTHVVLDPDTYGVRDCESSSLVSVERSLDQAACPQAVKGVVPPPVVSGLPEEGPATW